MHPIELVMDIVFIVFAVYGTYVLHKWHKCANTTDELLQDIHEETMTPSDVVTCEECIYRCHNTTDDEAEEMGGCTFFKYAFPNNFYCYYGKRKESKNETVE